MRIKRHNNTSKEFSSLVPSRRSTSVSFYYKLWVVVVGTFSPVYLPEGAVSALFYMGHAAK